MNTIPAAMPITAPATAQRMSFVWSVISISISKTASALRQCLPVLRPRLRAGRGWFRGSYQLLGKKRWATAKTAMDAKNLTGSSTRLVPVKTKTTPATAPNVIMLHPRSSRAAWLRWHEMLARRPCSPTRDKQQSRLVHHPSAQPKRLAVRWISVLLGCVLSLDRM